MPLPPGCPLGYTLHENERMVLVSPFVGQTAEAEPITTLVLARAAVAGAMGVTDTRKGAYLQAVFMPRRRVESMAEGGVRRARIALTLDAYARGRALPQYVDVRVVDDAPETVSVLPRVMPVPRLGVGRPKSLPSPARVPKVRTTAERVPSAAYVRLEYACYALASERFGRGAALSNDREGQGWIVRVWRPNGSLGLLVEAAKTKVTAMRAAKKALS